MLDGDTESTELCIFVGRKVGSHGDGGGKMCGDTTKA